MEIIKHGDHEKLLQIMKFNCDNCGCIFKADKNEYSRESAPYNGVLYTCNCPECGDKVYLYKE